MAGEELRFADGTTMAVVSRPADPETGALEMRFDLAPDCGSPPPHVHPLGQSELFECVEGEFELLLGEEWHKLRPGDSKTVRPATRHTFRNRSGAHAIVRNVHDPAHSFERYIRRVHALAEASGSTRPGPRTALGIALLWREHSDTIQPADTALKIAFGALATIGGPLKRRVLPD